MMMMFVPLAAAFLLVLTYFMGFSRKIILIDLACLILLASQAPHMGALLGTMAIESAIVFFLARMLALPPMRLVVASLLINTLTHPLFVTFALDPSGEAWLISFLMGELAVFGTEAFLYIWVLGAPFSSTRVGKALSVSLLANLASAGVGFVLPV